MKTIIHTYKFDCSKPEDRVAYQALTEERRASGVKLFDFLALSRDRGNAKDFSAPELDGVMIELEADFINENQWNTGPVEGFSESGLRVFDWSESIYPNADIKEGHWLEQTEEMKAVRADNFKCGYCGHMVPSAKVPADGLCDQCIDSEYLKPEQFHLLRMLPAGKSFNGKRPAFTPEELAIFEPRFHEAQINGATERGKIRIARRREEITKERDKVINGIDATVQQARDLYGARMWLVDHCPELDGNMIFYSHTKEWNFGWRTPFNASELPALAAKLERFPFPYTTKKV